MIGSGRSRPSLPGPLTSHTGDPARHRAEDGLAHRRYRPGLHRVMDHDIAHDMRSTELWWRQVAVAAISFGIAPADIEICSFAISSHLTHYKTSFVVQAGGGDQCGCQGDTSSDILRTIGLIRVGLGETSEESADNLRNEKKQDNVNLAKPPRDKLSNLTVAGMKQSVKSELETKQQCSQPGQAMLVTPPRSPRRLVR